MGSGEPLSIVSRVLAHPADHDEQAENLQGVNTKNDVEEFLIVVEVLELIVDAIGSRSVGVQILGQPLHQVSYIRDVCHDDELQDGERGHTAAKREATAAQLGRALAGWLVTSLCLRAAINITLTLIIVDGVIDLRLVLVNVCVYLLLSLRRVGSTARLLNAIVAGFVLRSQQLLVQLLRWYIVVHCVSLTDEQRAARLAVIVVVACWISLHFDRSYNKLLLFKYLFHV